MLAQCHATDCGRCLTALIASVLIHPFSAARPFSISARPITATRSISVPEGRYTELLPFLRRTPVPTLVPPAHVSAVAVVSPTSPTERRRSIHAAVAWRRRRRLWRLQRRRSWTRAAAAVPAPTSGRPNSALFKLFPLVDVEWQTARAFERVFAN